MAQACKFLAKGTSLRCSVAAPIWTEAMVLRVADVRFWFYAGFVNLELTMANRRNLGDLRAAIENINREVMDEGGNGEAPNAVVLARLKQERSPLIAHFSQQLIAMALTKLLNDVCRQTAGRSAYNKQRDLFDGYRKIPRSVTILRGLKKDTAKLSVSEAEHWLDCHSDRVVNKNYEGFRRLVEDCRAHARSSDETIEQVLKRINGTNDNRRTLELASS